MEKIKNNSVEDSKVFNITIRGCRLDENDADLISTPEVDIQEHYAWVLDDKTVIVYERDPDYGGGILLYHTVEEYMEEMNNTWVINEAKKIDLDLFKLKK